MKVYGCHNVNDGQRKQTIDKKKKICSEEIFKIERKSIRYLVLLRRLASNDPSEILPLVHILVQPEKKNPFVFFFFNWG